MNKTNFLLWIAFVAFASYLVGQIFRGFESDRKSMEFAEGKVEICDAAAAL